MQMLSSFLLVSSPLHLSIGNDYSHLDERLKYCNECKCHICNYCDCSVYHLDYQLAYWNTDVCCEGEILTNYGQEDTKKTEGKKRGKKKKRNNQGGKNQPVVEKEEPIDAAAIERFKECLRVFYSSYDMMKVSQILQSQLAIVCSSRKRNVTLHLL